MRLGTVTNLADHGRVGERPIAHYRTVARGGAGTIVTEALRVRAAGSPDVHLIGDAVAPRRLANAIEEGHRAGRAV